MNLMVHPEPRPAIAKMHATEAREMARAHPANAVRYITNAIQYDRLANPKESS